LNPCRLPAAAAARFSLPSAAGFDSQNFRFTCHCFNQVFVILAGPASFTARCIFYLFTVAVYFALTIFGTI
jgi:hypothetical protein